MKQKKINDILYVFQVTPYEITEDTDAHVIKVQLESYDGFVELNESLASKFVKYNYEMFTVHQQEWAPYVDAKEDADLEWSSDSATAAIGETNTYPTLTNTDNVEVTYDSSDTSVATIASDGTITLLEAGTTTISAIFAGDDTYNAKTVSYSLIVKEVPDLAWSSDSATAIVGETNTYPTLTNTDNVDVTYSSSDTSVASIASDGTVTILAAGSTTISAAFAGDTTYVAKTVSYSLTVKEVPDLSWSSDSATATVGETNTYPTLTNTDNVEVTYDSSDTSVATIASDGTITLLTAGSTTISAIFAGDTTYVAKTVSYSLTVNVPAHDYSTDYFTTKALASGNISFSGSGVSYRKNNGEWTNYTGAIPVVQDDVVEWKGTITPGYSDGIGRISSTGDIDAYGNVMSMLFGDNFANQTSLEGKNYAFKNLFSQNDKLINAENLILPATTLSLECYSTMFNNCSSLNTTPILPAMKLVSDCYSGMFYMCSGLTTTPELPAITLASSCYKQMFMYCSSLTTTPVLPVTTLADSCYYSMFRNCTELTTGPELPATTLANSCYANMFNGCTHLNNVTCLATDISASDCVEYWLASTAASGTFYKDPNMTGWVVGDNVPSGWTIQDYSSDATIDLDDSGVDEGL